MVSSRVPTVCLGKINSGEQDYYGLEESNGIEIWFARNIRPEEEGYPILIDVRKIFLGHELIISGAKLDVVTS